MTSPSSEEQGSSVAAVSPNSAPHRHPIGLWFFFWGEFAERSSFYGMRAILPMYLTTALKFPDTEAGPIYYWFKMAVYFLPLVGGWIADRWLGKYWTIVGFSIPYVLGHFILGIESREALYVALLLLACGSGVIKPNVSSLMGETYDQQRPGQESLRAAAFMWFYFAVNVGALISTLALPMIRSESDDNYALAFQFPAWLMVAALAAFALGKPHYAVESRTVVPATPDERREKRKVLGRLFAIFGLMVFFWVPYEHNDSLWVFFARDYVDRHVPFLSHPVPPDQIQVLNPLFVLILIPLFGWVFRTLDPNVRVFTRMRKILAGFAATTLATGIMAAAGYLANPSEPSLSIWWPVVAYIVLTAGEVLVYGTGLELAYSMAPKDMKGFVTACFLLTNTLGNFVNTWLSSLYGGSLTDSPDTRGPLAPGDFFALATLIVGAATIAFWLLDYIHLLFFYVIRRLRALSS